MKSAILHLCSIIFILCCVQHSALANERFSIPAFTVTVAKTNVSACGNGRDGSITLTIAGGTAPYNCLWTGPNAYTAGNSSSVSGLSIGYYTATVTDATAASVTVTGIHIGFAFSVYITNSGGLSSGCGNTGSIILYGNAGVLPYRYSLDGINFQAGNTFINLAAGAYTGFIKDAAGCVSSKPIIVAAAPPIVVSPFVRGTSSCEDKGSIEIYRTGGVPPYMYSLDGINFQVNNKFFDLTGGLYTAWVRDSKGCLGSRQVFLQKDAPIMMLSSVVNASSCNYDGVINVQTTGGQSPYYYMFNGDDAGVQNTFSNLWPDVHMIKVKDAKGCSDSISVQIMADEIIVNAEKQDASECLVADGSIMITNTGQFAPFLYSIDGFNFQESNVFTNVSSGIYYCYVKDSKGCSAYYSGIFVGPAGCSPERSKTIASTKTFSASRLTAYPNPFTSSFTLSLPDMHTRRGVAIIISDVTGKVLFQTHDVKKQYTLGANLKPGIYIVDVLYARTKESLRMIKY